MDAMDRFTCDWVFKTLVVLCDGRVVCGCADPAGDRPLGDLKRESITSIWNSARIHAIRKDLNEGFSPFCLPCGLKRMLKPDEPPPQQPIIQETLPRLFIEPTVLCNLACTGSVCSRDSGLARTRSEPLMDMELFRSLLHEAGPHLTRIDLFNYGEPFIHPQSIDMIETIKGTFPGVLLYVSTNGLMIRDEWIDRIVRSGLDEMTFSIDGTDQASYEAYRRGGDFQRAFRIMRDVVASRDRLKQETPIVNWRYILFKWNDSFLRMRTARKMALDAGIDRLVWEITDHPEEAKSRRYQIGTWRWNRIRNEIWDVSQLANAIDGKRFRAKIRAGTAPIRLNAGQPGSIVVMVENTGGALWPRHTRTGRRTVRLGAQLLDESRHLIDLNYSRAFLSNDLRAGDRASITIELPPINIPGRYFLKLDMVCEGVEWFESVGSETPVRRIEVVSTSEGTA